MSVSRVAAATRRNVSDNMISDTFLRVAGADTQGGCLHPPRAASRPVRDKKQDELEKKPKKSTAYLPQRKGGKKRIGHSGKEKGRVRVLAIRSL